MNTIPEEFARLLGKVSDRELSKRSGISPYYLKMARQAAGIEAFSHEYSLPTDVVSQLGKVPDALLSDQYGIPGTVLHRAREARGIPKYRGPRVAKVFLSVSSNASMQSPIQPTIDIWTAEIVAQLGVKSDAEIAEMAGVSLGAARSKRLLSGIKPIRLGKWKREWRDLLGEVPDKVLADFTGGVLCLATVRAARRSFKLPACPPSKAPPIKLTSDWLELLGKISDKKLAEISGGVLSVSGVRIARLERGIPSYTAQMQQRVSWTAEWLDLLGKISDKNLAVLSDGVLTVHSVRLARIERNIPSYKDSKTHLIKWTDEWLELLGKVPDTVLAEKTGGLLSTWSVRQARIQRNIPPLSSGWTEEWLELLGKISDKDLSSRTGGIFSRKQVESARNRRNIAAYKAPKPLPANWLEEWVALLGKVTDQQLAEKSGGVISIKEVREVRVSRRIPICHIQKAVRGNWTSEWLDLLGKIPDKELAERSGGVLSVENVARTRRRRRISVCPAPRSPSGGSANRSDVVVLMGTVSDYQVSKLTGVNRSEITRQRQKLGIPAFSKSGRPSKK